MLIKPQANYNINHNGYLKNHQILRHNLSKAKFKSYNLDTPKNAEAYREAYRALDKFYENNIIRAAIYILWNNITKRLSNNFLDKNLIKTTNKVFKMFNELEFKYEGEKFSYSTLRKKMTDEKNIQKKEEISAILKAGLNTLQSPFRNLVQIRNNFAQKKGYENYYQYMLEKKYGTSEKEIDECIKNYCENNNIYANLQKREQLIAEKHSVNIKEIPTALIGEPLALQSGINNYIKSPEQIIDLAKKTFSDMGFNIEQLEKEDRITFDLGVEDKKINRTYCTSFITNYSIGICARIYKNIGSLFQLMHELGHGMHYLNMFKWLPKNLKNVDTCVTEAIAMMFESLILKENILKDIAPQNVIDKFKEYKKLDGNIKFLQLAVDAQFEKELYKNPEQDFEKLYQRIEKEYYGKNLNSEWLVSHFITSPGYVQNYVRATILADKVYSSAREKIGNNLSETPETLKFLHKRVFGLGKLVNPKSLEKLLNL